MPDDSNVPDAGELHGLLCKGRWYRSLPTELQQRILAASRIRDFDKGEVIALEGAQPAGMSAVVSGEVKLVRQPRPGEESLLFICEPGFWFGEYAVLTNEKTLVSAIAKTRVRLLILPKREFDRIVEEEPRYYRHFAALGLEHAATFLKAFTHASSLEPEARLRGQLAVLSLLKRGEDNADAPVELPYSQSELASIIGVSRQTINQLMQTLAAQGLIEMGFRRVRVLAPEALLASL
jgi:CRP/FNR family transcriptional regulator, cyclic AMP receptor protein